MRYLTLFFLLFAFSCTSIKGVVTMDDGTPVKGAMVTIDCKPKSRVTGDSGYFRFRGRISGKTCKVRAWNPQNPEIKTEVLNYDLKGKTALEIKLKRPGQ